MNSKRILNFTNIILAKKKHPFVIEIDHDYSLIVIKSVLEDFRLAYFLNQVFDIALKKDDFHLDFHNKKGEFAVFSYENINTSEYWSLIANKQVVDKEENGNEYNMFAEISNTYILIPEEKKADYFLKIENNTHNITTIIKKINSIHRVITSYEINPNDLKSKDLLIF
ncbi:MAG TPA: IPExxxVDY family protein [Flavobacteriaceae bacterium]|nr:IPExxxVDY family protein [Flavobacteriaceae bacterium]